MSPKRGRTRLFFADLLWRAHRYDLAQRIEPTVFISRKKPPAATIERLRQRMLTGNWDRPLE